MTLISDQYRWQQLLMHADKRYGKSGGKWWQDVVALCRDFDCKTWLDYGCGTGKLAKNIRKTPTQVTITEYDPGVVGKTDIPKGRFDLVTCIDTLEHIEPEHLDAVLAHLNALTGKALFVVISTRLAGKILPDGRNAHLIVEPSRWWLDRLKNHFWVVRAWQVRDDELCAVLGPMP